MIAPSYKIEIDGKPISNDLQDRLLELSITDEINSNSDRVEIVFDDSMEDMEHPPTERKMKIYLGYIGQALTYMGETVVDEVFDEGPPYVVRVTGKGFESASKIANKRSKTWDSKSVGDLFRSIARENSLEARIDKFFDSIKLEQAEKANHQCLESDLHFARRVSDSYGGSLKVNDGKLLVSREGSGVSASGKSSPTIDIGRVDVKRRRFQKVKRGAYGSAEVLVKNLETGELQKRTIGVGEPTYRFTETFKSIEEAEIAARSKIGKAQSFASQLMLELKGDPRLVVEVKVKLSGFKKDLDGVWIVSRAEHKLSRRGGYTTTIDLRKEIDSLKKENQSP
jgi:phage protein D